MSNLRSSTKILLSTLQRVHYSSSNEKTSQEVLKQVQNVAEKAKSEKLLNLLPYLQNKNIGNNPQTSIIDSQSEDKGTSEQTKCIDQVGILVTRGPAEASGSKIVSSENITVPSGSSNAADVTQDPPKSLPVMIVSRPKTPTMDLTNVMLPLTLHLSDKKSLLVDAVVQDLKLFYLKSSSAIDSWYLVAKTKGKTFYISAEEYMKRPGVLQDFLRERISKTAVALYDPKASALVNVDVNSIVEKVKQLIESIVANIKKIFENKSKPEEKHEKKSEEKAGKVDKKAEEGEKSKVAAQQ